jgi:ring-1,2-phenylacetyl-CoA epoxidase subunit PaaC
MEAKLTYLLQLADNALVLGHRLSEWCGHGPVLEQDIAVTNIALDHLGQARSFYQHAAEIVNGLPEPDRQDLFSAPALQQKAGKITEDDLAYLRDGWDFKNVLLVEQPNQDWAYTIARSFFYDHYAVLLYTFLKEQADPAIAAIAEKSLKEAAYHKRWSSEWVIRLGDGTEESQRKMQAAIDYLWSFSGELFQLSDAEKALLVNEWGLDMRQIKDNWDTEVAAILEEATLSRPDEAAWMQSGGKTGIHTEHLGFLLAEMQYMQRAYPGMDW